MSSNNETNSIEVANSLVGQWNETYRWIPIAGAVAAIAMAFSAGANNLAAPFSTLVGSGILTLLRASVIACAIYVPGAAFASKSSVHVLFSDFIEENQPSEGFLMWSLVVVLITATIWLAIATHMELPVSSQQSIQGALLGTILVTEGFKQIPLWNKNYNHNFNGGGLLWIFLEWTVAPLIACMCAIFLFTVMKIFLLSHENGEKRILIFLLIDYGISAGLLCLFVIYQVIPNETAVYGWFVVVAVVTAALVGVLLSLVVVVPLAIKMFDKAKHKFRNQKNSPEHQSADLQDQSYDTKADSDAEIEDPFNDLMQTRILHTVYEEEDQSCASPDKSQDIELKVSLSQSTIGQSTSTQFKQLLESTPNRLIQTKNFQKIKNNPKTTQNAFNFIKKFIKSAIFPVIEYDKKTLIQHALAEKYDDMEDFFSFPQLLASCIFALIQSATEVAAVVSPYGAILEVFSHRAKHSGNLDQNMESIDVTWWFRALGGFSAALGFFLCGSRMTQCLGGKLTYISNSRGLASQLSAVTAMLTVTRMNLPVSSVHVFVGSLVGVGIADNPQNVNWKLLLKFICGWVLTIVFCSGIAYVIFSISIHTPSYVVP
ncbi:Phosphate transporter [Quillaja saponaria]|uniref:Phosphate transporter n=1 Tax=Quillaja saponaria TaxID=32244 RepID=A0AAD7M2H8_QUISA|nr:Phosphate transporter [Quillaja saponaria]